MSFIRKIKRGNAVYLAEVENQWRDGRCIQKHIRYIGKEEQGKQIIASSISHTQIEQVKLYGPLLVLHHLAKEIELPQHLGKYNKELLSLVYAHCLNYTSVNQMSRWFAKTDLALLLDLPTLTEERLLKALDSIEGQDTIEQLEQKIFKSTREKYKIKNSGVIYDVTNTYLYGKKCSLARFGHDKDGIKGRPLIQIALGVTRAEGIPIFHKTFNGNIHDAKTLEDILTSLQAHKFQHSFIVFDRGITSQNSVKALKDMGWDVVGGVPLRGKYQALLRKTMKKHHFLSLEKRVRQNGTTWYVVTEPHRFGETNGTIAWCFNEKLRREVRESRYDEIEYAKKCLRHGKPIKESLRRYFDAKGAVRQETLKTEEEFDGYSCIFTTKAKTKNEILKLYFGDKDVVEKAFHSLKGVVKVRPIRHWLYNRVITHVFVCYLAYLLLSLLRKRLAPIGLSAVEALRELDTMYRVYLRDEKKGFQFQKTVALTKKQELILKTLDKKLLKA